MRLRSRRFSAHLILCGFLACVSLAFPASVLPAAAAPAAGKPAPAQPEDALGRSTPYGTVSGFIVAADKGDYRLAGNYLQGTPSSEKK